MERLEDLALWQNQLIEEEEFITKLLADIDEQINCLQVEQMQLSSAMREKEAQSRNAQTPNTEKKRDKAPEKLDLTVPATNKNGEEEEEDDDEDDSL